MVINIPSNSVGKGHTLAPYKGPGPPLFTGLHRYVLLIYEQKDEHGPDVDAFTRMRDRMHFKTEEFAQSNDLKLVAANFYISQNEYNHRLWFVPYVLMSIAIVASLTKLVRRVS